MASSTSRSAERDDTREPKMEHPPALTPLQELTLADGYRWAALDVTDLDPPTWFPPN